MSQLTLRYTQPAASRFSPTAVGVVLLAHAGLLALLIACEIIPAPQEMAALMVQILPSEQPAPPQPKILPVQPQKETPRPLAKSPTLASNTSAPAAQTAPEVREAPPVSPAPPAEVAISQPRYDTSYLDNPSPVYPTMSKRMGEEGKVLLRVHVEANGLPSRIEIKTSSGSLRLDQAAEQAVWRWKFVPAKRGNEAVAAWVVVPISFNLRD